MVVFFFAKATKKRGARGSKINQNVMKTLTEQLETFAEGQKQVYNYWTDASKKMMATFANKTESKPETVENLLKEWYEKQQAFFEKTMKVENPQDAMSKAADNFKDWAALQVEFSEKMVNFYQKNAPKTAFELPKTWNGDFNNFGEFMQKGTQWIQENIMEKLPTNMRPHLSNFNNAYGDMFKNWENLTKMMEYGIYTKDAVEKYFSPDAYKNFVNQFMGYNTTFNVSEMLDKTNAMFEKMMTQFNVKAPNMNGMMDMWTAQTQKMSGLDMSTYFKLATDLSAQANESLTPYYNVLSPSKETKAAKILKDIQFTYIAFIVKMAEMQSSVYQAGQNALPETLKAYYETFEKTKELPDYQEFFNQYINVLENHITEVLKSSTYSKLQNEVAKAGLGVKSKMEELMELMLADMPIVLRSEANDIAQETNTLRKKVRTLERKLEAIEKAIGGKEAVANAATPTKTAQKRTATRTKTTSKKTENVADSTDKTEA
jgi:BMFP domain-containing protein YqiC